MVTCQATVPAGFTDTTWVSVVTMTFPLAANTGSPARSTASMALRSVSNFATNSPTFDWFNVVSAALLPVFCASKPYWPSAVWQAVNTVAATTAPIRPARRSRLPRVVAHPMATLPQLLWAGTLPRAATDLVDGTWQEGHMDRRARRASSAWLCGRP